MLVFRLYKSMIAPKKEQILDVDIPSNEMTLICLFIGHFVLYNKVKR